MDVEVMPTDELGQADELVIKDELAGLDEVARLDELAAADELAGEDELAATVELAGADELALTDDLPVCADEALTADELAKVELETIDELAADKDEIWVKEEPSTAELEMEPVELKPEDTDDMLEIVSELEANDELATVEDKTAALYKFILDEPPQYSVAFAKHVNEQPVAPLTASVAKSLPQ